MAYACDARALASQLQSVSRDSVGRLNDGFGQEFIGPWPPSELWLVGSFAAFADGTLNAERFVAANKNRHEGQDPPPSLEEEGFEETSDPEAPKKQTAKRTGAVEFLGTASSTSKPADSKSTYPVELHLKLSGKSAQITGGEKTKEKKPAPKVKKAALKKGMRKKSWMFSSDSEGETANVGAQDEPTEGAPTAEEESRTSAEGEAQPSKEEEEEVQPEPEAAVIESTDEDEEEIVVVETESAPTSQRAPKSQTAVAPETSTQADVQAPPQAEKTAETSTAEHDYARRNAPSIESSASEQASSQAPLVIAESTPTEAAAETQPEAPSTSAPQKPTSVSAVATDVPAAATDVPAVAASEEAAGEDARSHEAGTTSAQSPPTEPAVSRESKNEFVDAPTGSQSTVVPPTQPPEERPDEPP